jgi:hypothetical protein
MFLLFFFPLFVDKSVYPNNILATSSILATNLILMPVFFQGDFIVFG